MFLKKNIPNDFGYLEMGPDTFCRDRSWPNPAGHAAEIQVNRRKARTAMMLPERLYLIDWEYAANGLQIMDYAALATEWQIDDATILAKTDFNPESLTKAKALYQYLCAL